MINHAPPSSFPRPHLFRTLFSIVAAQQSPDYYMVVIISRTIKFSAVSKILSNSYPRQRQKFRASKFYLFFPIKV